MVAMNKLRSDRIAEGRLKWFQAVMDRPGRKARINPALLLFLLFPALGIVAGLAIGGERSQGVQVPPAVGYTPAASLVNTPAPDFALQKPDGQSIRLSSLRGQWVFLNFWATWCPPCREEMPAFQKLLDGGFGPVDGKLTVLAVDYLETTDKVNVFFDEFKLTIPAVIDKDGAVGRLYGVVQLPVTFVIDPAGLVRYEQLGQMTPELLKQYLSRQGSIDKQ
jgi:cytochrome c biogenesis protein CcmG/thiol:disulfide interchange protein DsbE